MSGNQDRLYDLVPAVYRLRDAAQGYPLQALLRVLAQQVNVLEADIAGLYENWFIETCQDWVVPYIGTLIGYVPVTTGVQTATGARAIARERITVPRREVANTIRFRRRKGTLSVLEDLAEAVAGWPARAVEFYRLLAVTQNIDYLHMDRGRWADLRDGAAMDLIGSAFDRLARNVDVRRMGSAHVQGRANIPEVGVFIWRLQSFPLTRAPAYHYDQESPNCFLFSPLGNDCQLFINPQAAVADPPLPMRISRRAMEQHQEEGKIATVSGIPFFYGPTASIMIWTGSSPVAVDASRIVAADLSDWTYKPVGDQVAVDPVLGRIVFAHSVGRRPAVTVSFNYGFSAPMGGGQYPRTLLQPAGALLRHVGPGGDFARIADALAWWRTAKPQAAIIEILDSGVYAEPVVIELAKGQTLELRAANGARPVLRLLDYQSGQPDGLNISGDAGWFVLDGIIVTGRSMQVSGSVSGVAIRHCTLVPGWGLECDCSPTHPSDPSVEVSGSPLCITIDHSIVGAIQVDRDMAALDPMRLVITDSIVDAMRTDQLAIAAPAKLCADTRLTLRRCTVIGRIETHELELAENSILLGTVLACRRQAGCIRFCYVAPGSRTPRRFECQPDLVEQAITAEVSAGRITAAQSTVLLAAARLRVRPEFDSLRYGHATYGRLAATTATEITTGADDSAEMGAFHDLYQPQRMANLVQRLSEYVPAGADIGVITAN
jgi:hypothetical protein